MFRGMMVFPIRKSECQALILIFEDAALILTGYIEGDGFTVLPGHIKRLNRVNHPEINNAVDANGTWNYAALISLYTAAMPN